MESLDKFSEFVIFRIGDFAFTAGKVITVALTLLITILVVWLIKLLMIRKRSPSKFDRGNIYALFQIIKYVIWIISILLILETLGLKLNALLAGSAALLVGIGLGLQNTFINFIAGIILLFEGSIKVGDILEVDGQVVRILKIGLRTSKAINRDDIVIILPNSLMTSNKVINWSHQEKKTRFRIKVGVPTEVMLTW